MSSHASQIKKQEIKALWEKNPNLKPRLDKVVVNLSVGQSGEILQKAASVLEELGGQKPQFVGAKKSIKEFGIRKGEKIAVMVTLRGEKAVDVINRLMIERDFKLLKKCFDNYGNLSFGIKEHINIPGMKYDPSTGIFGFEVSIRLARAGHRVRARKVMPTRIPRRQYVSKAEAQLYMEENFKAEIVEKIEIAYY